MLLLWRCLSETKLTAQYLPMVANTCCGAAATMLRRHEPTEEKVVPTALGITALELPLDQVHSSIAVTNSTLYVA